ncbi:hypothetical protein CEXT_351021 [Caerostris extrusa]|uniref:Uncharacterized protein n=1 Tax=Caerostris extrusa TaxID=172846 RepID=A0AAV4XCM6_CAEEX|nr:hypothetical protein CEXT_351021 [Caerostris extrusa]
MQIKLRKNGHQRMSKTQKNNSRKDEEAAKRRPARLDDARLRARRSSSAILDLFRRNERETADQGQTRLRAQSHDYNHFAFRYNHQPEPLKTLFARYTEPNQITSYLTSGITTHTSNDVVWRRNRNSSIQAHFEREICHKTSSLLPFSDGQNKFPRIRFIGDDNEESKSNSCIVCNHIDRLLSFISSRVMGEIYIAHG